MTTNRMIGRYLDRILQAPIYLRLFTSATRLPGSDDIDELSVVEVVGGGYREVILTRGDWMVNTTLGTPFAEAPVQQFRFDGTSAVRVMGSYLAETDGGLLDIKPFEMPLDIRRNGDTIPVRPILRLSSIG